jgi:hypothetical protein
MGSGAVTGGLFGGGADLGNASGTVTINMADVQRAVQIARTSARQIEQSFSGIDRGTKQAEKGIKGLNLSLQSLAGVGAGLVGAKFAADMVLDLGRLSAKADASRESFDKLAAGIGSSGNQMFNAMKKASDGMISDVALVQNANVAMLLKAADTGEEMATLLEIAKNRAEATGRSFEDAFTRISQGIGKREPELIDELGLVLRLPPAYATYAAQLGISAEQLTEVQRTQALYNEVVRQSADLLEQSADSTDSAFKKMQRYEATIENTKQALGELLINAGLPEALDEINESLVESEQQVSGWADAWVKARAAIGLNPILGTLGVLPAEGIRNQIRGLENMRAGLTAGLDNPGANVGELNSKLAEVNSQLAQFRAQLALTGGSVGGFRAFGNSPSDMRVGAGSGGPQFTDIQLAEQRAAQLDFAQETQEIERNAQEQRLDATRSYESQRTSTIASYERTIAREAEDFGRQRARAQAQFQKQIADMAESAAEREADMAEDLADSIADLQSGASERIAEAQDATNKRISEIEEDYRKNRERAERDHRDNLLDAAARLDATAVFNEQKRFARESADAKDAHDEAISDAQEGLQERIDQERENLAERIQQEQEAHAERLQDAREADAERLADMQADFAEQQRLEDEDRAIRLQRMAEDHAAQLASMATANAEQMAEIDRQEAEELKSAQEAHLKELEAAGLFNKQWKAIQDAREREALQSWDRFWQEFNGRLQAFGPQTSADAAKNQWSGIQLGDPSTWNFSSAPPATRSGDTRNFNMAPGAIQVFAAPGQSAQSVAEAVRNEMTRVFRDLAN